jgi:hypothetical protein
MTATWLRSPALGEVVPGKERVLLVNAPAVDLRLPWARWQQPIGLLQIGTKLRERDGEVRLIDCLKIPSNGRLFRERVERVEIDGKPYNIWRFGVPPRQVTAKLRQWERQGWRPDRILVSCQSSTWWRGARELTASLRAALDVPIVLGGAYPTSYPGHAATHGGADVIVEGDVTDATRTVPDLTLYHPDPLPRFAGVHLLHPAGIGAGERSPRRPAEVADEVAGKAALGVTTVAFLDDWLGPDEHDPLAAALRAIVGRGITKIGFVALGNFSPRLVDDELARLLRQAHFRQITLHDDLEHTPTGIRYLAAESDYARCVRSLHRAGYLPRTEAIAAAIVAGIPGEDIGQVAERLVRIGSIVGSVNLVPYQLTPVSPEAKLYERWLPRLADAVDPSSLNAQLYPLARAAGASLEDYWELTRLAALLNSKYRSRTFDFLGTSLTSRLVQTSLRERRWDPFVNRPSPLPILTLAGGNGRDRPG